MQECLNGCILWEARVVILTQGQKSVLDELHETHLDASKIKAITFGGQRWMLKLKKYVARKCSDCHRPVQLL